MPEALESALGSLSLAPARRSLWPFVLDLGVRLAETRRNPGLLTAALVSLGSVTGSRSQVEQAGSLAARAEEESPRDGDLLAFARLKAGIASVAREGDRPAAVLVRALAGDPQALADLRAAAKGDPLVRHLALLDPALATAVR